MPSTMNGDSCSDRPIPWPVRLCEPLAVANGLDDRARDAIDGLPGHSGTCRGDSRPVRAVYRVVDAESLGVGSADCDRTSQIRPVPVERGAGIDDHDIAASKRRSIGGVMRHGGIRAETH